MKLDNLNSPSKEMKDFFDKRTNKHVSLVQKFAAKIADKFPELSAVVEQANIHDESKYKSPEYEPYLYITWQYKQRDAGKEYNIPDHIDDSAATLHHITHNSHHPEFHDPDADEKSLNKKDRDALPDKMTDATKMPDIDVAEMVADWCAMSEEKGGIPKEWAEKVIGKRWKFSKHQTDLIYKLINAIWDD